ncbi:hypothetical protein [Neobacillus cucumis]|uniref:hypothetical protein n=1 Tax=Neobacillus cucumis TaxID=1740721 RepID=UPI0019653ADF|nr:hypothetical protein [Neobacillus cucumis]MBM7655575.1 hypothetical protein [Neobacillus cucumis]
MQKIEVTKVKQIFNEGAKQLTDKIFIGDKDLEFLDYIKSEYESSLSPSQLKYFKRDRERNISIISLF